MLVLPLACGGSSGGTPGLAACGDFTPCGGSLVGTWNITNYCSDLTSTTSSTSTCGITVGMNNMRPSGTVTFTSSGTYSSATKMSGTADFTYSKDCLTQMNQTCAQLGTPVGGADAGVSMSCNSTAAGDCACTESLNGTTGAEQGTYTISGTSMTMTKTGSTSTPTPSDYCVRGNRLTISATSSSATTSGTVVIVLTK